MLSLFEHKKFHNLKVRVSFFHFNLTFGVSMHAAVDYVNKSAPYCILKSENGYIRQTLDVRFR